MLLGLIADTHIPEAGPDLWPQVYERFRQERVDAILHAGDIHVLAVLDRLEQRVGVPVFACRGNGDDGSGGRPVCPEDPRLRPHWILEHHGFRIGLTHDCEASDYRPVEAIMQYAFGGPVDIVVCGDTHVQMVELVRGTLVVNPGSPMFPRNMNTTLGTIGFLHLTDDTAEAWIEPLHPEGGPVAFHPDKLGHPAVIAGHPILDHLTVTQHYPDQWVLFAVHEHRVDSGLSHGTVIAAGFAPEEAAAIERRVRFHHPATVLLKYHTTAPPPRGIGQVRLR